MFEMSRSPRESKLVWMRNFGLREPKQNMNSMINLFLRFVESALHIRDKEISFFGVTRKHIIKTGSCA